ncbi:hypothetical protein A2617_02800 [Candidatus Daviesbacteria bacterium RIFOXYD1_FULL_41_10]|uniref:Uncharacterized protein n=1 Tax=Candidatus Daviesbacteria bacterium RIFOXYD1_FULL_41_10 TaxID=1797801 RepID=A0A1F5N375_9BACT|nr:MAG: hypothetical protein A2617_02800 [Candidatus Daviesbacteria bacterium RIFOXYD1_FULL_41_10]
MAEQEFEVVTFDGAKLARYCGASFPEDRSLKADVYLSLDMFYDFEGSYAQVVPRFRPNWPTHQELADEALEDILLRGWQRKIPPDVRTLLATTRTAVFSAHGNTLEDTGWYAHIEDEVRIPVQTLVEKHLSNYETIILAVCNPEGATVLQVQGTVIYPAFLFGVPEETEMITKKALSTIQPQ